MGPGQHATLGASKAERWMNCAGSVNMEADLPDSVSVYAREGTAAHELAERCLRTGLSADTWLDSIFKVKDGEVQVDEVMTEAVQVFVDHVSSLGGQRPKGDEPPESRVKSRWPQLFIEQFFDLAKLNPPGPMYGTADAVVWHPMERVLEVVDFKYGAGVAVGVVGNPQLRYYALGAVLSLKVRPELVRITVVQPRASHHQGIIRSEEITWDELVAFKRELLDLARRTVEPDAPLKVGPWCRFCKAIAICPEQKQYAIETAQADFTEEGFKPPAPATLSEEDIARVLAAADVLGDWLKAVEAHALSRLERGLEVPGYKLVDKRVNRTWADEEKAEKVLFGLLSDKAYAPVRLLSVAQAEKALKAIDGMLPAELVEKKTPGRKLARDTDPRVARIPAVVEEFEADPTLG